MKKSINNKKQGLMKKSYLMLAATATILASCAQTDKINTDLKDTTEPKVIGFSSYSEKATKGENNANDLEFYHNTFAVYGTKQSKNDNSVQYLFGGKATAAGTQAGVTCSYLDPALPAILGDWRYDDPRYWDKQATFDFIAYAPVAATNPIRYYYNAANAEVGDAGNEFKSTSTYTLEGTNIQATPTTAEKVKGFTVEAGKDLDLMVSAYSGSIDGNANAAVNPHTEYVNLIFRHILSKFNVKVTKGESLNNAVVTIKEVTITGLYDSGDYTSSTYNPGTTTGWTSSSVDNTYKLTYANATGTVLNSGTYAGNPLIFTPGAPYYFIESIIMPQDIADDQVEVTVKYSIKSTVNGIEQDFNYAFDLYDLINLHSLKEGYNYTLTCTIQPEIIKFDATASAWDNVFANKDIIVGEQ